MQSTTRWGCLRWRTCLACVRLWVHSPVPQDNKNVHSQARQDLASTMDIMITIISPANRGQSPQVCDPWGQQSVPLRKPSTVSSRKPLSAQLCKGDCKKSDQWWKPHLAEPKGKRPWVRPTAGLWLAAVTHWSHWCGSTAAQPTGWTLWCLQWCLLLI